MTTTVLLTGCSGFLGRNFIENTYLKDLDARVICISRTLPQSVKRSSNIEYILISQPAYVSIEKYRKLIEKKRVEAIVHMAALVGEGKGSWRKYVDINVKWPMNLMKAFIEANTHHHIFIYISTVGVHGTIPPELPANEKTPYAPDGYYHTSKMLAEKELMKIATETDIPLIILRPTIMYGKYDQGFLWKLLKISRKFFLPLANGIRIHLLDVRTMVRVIDACLLKMQRPNVFIVADEKPIELNNFLSYLNAYIPGIKFIEVPRKFMQTVNCLTSPLKKYANFTLLCESWYYDVSKLKSVLNMSLSSTVDRIKDYIWWYMRA